MPRLSRAPRVAAKHRPLAASFEPQSLKENDNHDDDRDPTQSPAREAPSAPARKRPLKIGIMLPESEREMAGETARWKDLLAMARATEELGFDSLWFADHLLMKVPGYEPQGAWECWSVLAALAACTSRIELGPFVSCTGYRNPALLAKIAETVDEISGGRLILGLGAGWAEPEYRAFGFPFDHRYSRFEEALHIITSLIRTGRVDFHGQFYTAEGCELRPARPAARRHADHDRHLPRREDDAADRPPRRSLECLGAMDGQPGCRHSRVAREDGRDLPRGGPRSRDT
ncbi:MAG: hypothetical protein KatS3mg059_1641 [Thermomicrobiales bacterium]|nr:MAG: hypothetical protein KatS3mg059_1641 [Thermomicrobiales bacterium]